MTEDHRGRRKKEMFVKKVEEMGRRKKNDKRRKRTRVNKRE